MFLQSAMCSVKFAARQLSDSFLRYLSNLSNSAKYRFGQPISAKAKLFRNMLVTQCYLMSALGEGLTHKTPSQMTKFVGDLIFNIQQ